MLNCWMVYELDSHFSCIFILWLKMISALNNGMFEPQSKSNYGNKSRDTNKQPCVQYSFANIWLNFVKSNMFFNWPYVLLCESDIPIMLGTTSGLEALSGYKPCWQSWRRPSPLVVPKFQVELPQKWCSD